MIYIYIYMSRQEWRSDCAKAIEQGLANLTEKGRGRRKGNSDLFQRINNHRENVSVDKLLENIR